MCPTCDFGEAEARGALFVRETPLQRGTEPESRLLEEDEERALNQALGGIGNEVEPVGVMITKAQKSKHEIYLGRKGNLGAMVKLFYKVVY